MSDEKILSLFLDLLPGVGAIKNIIELTTGKDAVTGEELDDIDTGLGILDLVPFGKIGKVGKHINKIVRTASTTKSIMDLEEENDD